MYLKLLIQVKNEIIINQLSRWYLLLNFHSASIYFVFNIFYVRKESAPDGSQHRMGVSTGKTQHRVRVSKSGRSS